jgi:ABC-type transporter Mla subunit MlaD
MRASKRTVNLRSVTTTLDTDTNVDVRNLVLANEEDRLVDLVPQDLGLRKLDGGSIELDQTLAALDVSDSSGGFLESMNGNSDEQFVLGAK